jgi:hypothetical protein
LAGKTDPAGGEEVGRTDMAGGEEIGREVTGRISLFFLAPPRIDQKAQTDLLLSYLVRLWPSPAVYSLNKTDLSVTGLPHCKWDPRARNTSINHIASFASLLLIGIDL